MSWTHSAAGLTLVSDRQLPGLPTAPSTRFPDIRTWTDACPSWASADGSIVYAAAHSDDRGTPTLVVSRTADGWRFRYADETQFWIDRAGAEIWMIWQPPLTFEDACTYLVGPVLGFAMRVRGELALHAGAIQVGDTAVAIVGPHGAGKSTAVAAFARRGFPVLTDDLLRVTEDDRQRAWAHPFGGIIRLWPDGESLVYGASGGLPRITPSWDKRALAIGPGGAPPAERPVVLSAIVCLGAPRDGIEPRVSLIRPAESLVRLAANTTAGYLLDSAARAREFVRLATLSSQVPVVEALSGTGPGSLDRFIESLLHWHQHLAALQPA